MEANQTEVRIIRTDLAQGMQLLGMFPVMRLRRASRIAGSRIPAEGIRVGSPVILCRRQHQDNPELGSLEQGSLGPACRRRNLGIRWGCRMASNHIRQASRCIILRPRLCRRRSLDIRVHKASRAAGSRIPAGNQVIRRRRRSLCILSISNRSKWHRMSKRHM